MHNTLLLPETTPASPLHLPETIDFSHDKNTHNIKRRTEFLSDSIEDFANLPIDEEAKTIKLVYFQYQGIKKNLIEIRTRNWLSLGRMLNIHRTKVESAGYQWTVWAVEHFPFLKQRRREMAMELANFGPKVEPYFFMGLDRLYDLFHKLQEYHKDPDFKLVSKRFRFIFKIEPETDETKDEKNKGADKIIEFFKFKAQTNNVNVNKDLLLDVIDSGVTFRKSDYEHIKNLATTNPTGAEDYLHQSHCIGATPKTKTSIQARESIHVILAKLIQTVKGFEKSKSYPPIPKTIFDEAMMKIQVLSKHV